MNNHHINIYFFDSMHMYFFLIDRLHSLTLFILSSFSVFCGPYCLPRSDIGFYPQNTKVLLPGGSKRRSSSTSSSSTTSRADQESMENNRSSCGASGYDHVQQEYNIMMHSSNHNEGIIVENNYQNSGIDRETLALFPLHPTGVLQGKTSAENSTTTFTSSETNFTGSEDGVSDQPFFDFFSSN